MSIILDFLKESFELDESLKDNKLYHVKDGSIKGNMLKANAQGIHLSQDLKGCKDVALSRNMKNPVFYEVILKDNNLKSPKCYKDIEYWSSINISSAVLNGTIQIDNLSEKEIEIFNKFANQERTKASFVDLQYIKNIFSNHGYNSILYPNSTESNTDFYSVMLFDNLNISEVNKIDINDNE